MIGVSMFYNVLQEKPISRTVNSQARAVEPFVYARKILPCHNIRFMNSRRPPLSPVRRDKRRVTGKLTLSPPQPGSPLLIYRQPHATDTQPNVLEATGRVKSGVRLTRWLRRHIRPRGTEISRRYRISADSQPNPPGKPQALQLGAVRAGVIAAYRGDSLERQAASLDTSLNWPARYSTHYSGQAAFLGGAGC